MYLKQYATNFTLSIALLCVPYPSETVHSSASRNLLDDSEESVFWWRGYVGWHPYRRTSMFPDIPPVTR